MPQIQFSRTALGPKFSEGARLVWVSAQAEEWSLNFIARLLDVSVTRVVAWVYGDDLPSLRHAVTIEEVIGVPARAWLSPPAEAFSPPASREAGNG